MFIKPRKTNLNPHALVYRRLTHLEKSRNTLIVFKCLNHKGAYRYFVFDLTKEGFDEIDINSLTIEPQKIIVVTTSTQVFQNADKYYTWVGLANEGNGTWNKSDTKPQNVTTLKETGYSNVAKYETNEYIFVGGFDYTIKGEVIGARTQQLKGNIMPLTSLNIQYYNDYINLDVDDLVVLNGQLFSVENPNYDVKHLPKDFKIYSCTLNSIL